VMGLPGKPVGIIGAEVEKYFRDGHIREIADYCKSDVINTYRVWLRYELFRGKLTDAAFQASESNLAEFIKARDNATAFSPGMRLDLSKLAAMRETKPRSKSQL